MVYFCCINVCIPCWYFFWWGASDMELWRTGYSNQCVSVFVTTWGSKGEFFHEERVFPWSPWRPWGIRAEYQPSNQPPKKLLCQESGPVVFAKNKCMWSWTVLLDSWQVLSRWLFFLPISDHWALKFPTDKHHAQKDRNGGPVGQVNVCFGKGWGHLALHRQPPWPSFPHAECLLVVMGGGNRGAARAIASHLVPVWESGFMVNRTLVNWVYYPTSL